MDAIVLLKDDHKTVEKLFKEFEKAGDSAYKTMRGIADKVMVSVEEHHVVVWMLSEPAGLDPEDERFDAKMCAPSPFWTWSGPPTRTRPPPAGAPSSNTPTAPRRALPDRGLDTDPCPHGRRQDLVPVGRGLGGEPLPAGHRHHPYREALGHQRCAGVQGDPHLGAGGDQDHVRCGGTGDRP
jgi:hypothetical protein